MKAKACETSIDSNEHLVFPKSVTAGDVRDTLGIVRKLRNTKQRRRHACIRAHGKTLKHRLWHVHVVMHILIKSLLLTRLFYYFLPCLLFTSLHPYSRVVLSLNCRLSKPMLLRLLFMRPTPT
ncbi:hypothetical protein AVEN_179024-1 [Araneus ventricosus]|uniref:Uncharacterized protein n=1 Tax=Araneus ventricosus TaxID=182803 RepID=A0A4Y2JNW0_ARAVE|nr:hypothetical protein AVEN_179024-1 [Araneus ventricosus]